MRELVGSPSALAAASENERAIRPECFRDEPVSNGQQIATKLTGMAYTARSGIRPATTRTCRGAANHMAVADTTLQPMATPNAAT